MTKTVPVLLAIAISVWLLATTAINVIWLAVFLVGVGMVVAILLVCLYDENAVFSGAGTLLFIVLMILVAIAFSELNQAMVLISLAGGFTFPLIMTSLLK